MSFLNTKLYELKVKSDRLRKKLSVWKIQIKRSYRNGI